MAIKFPEIYDEDGSLITLPSGLKPKEILVLTYIAYGYPEYVAGKMAGYAINEKTRYCPTVARIKKKDGVADFIKMLKEKKFASTISGLQNIGDYMVGYLASMVDINPSDVVDFTSYNKVVDKASGKTFPIYHIRFRDGITSLKQLPTSVKRCIKSVKTSKTGSLEIELYDKMAIISELLKITHAYDKENTDVENLDMVTAKALGENDMFSQGVDDNGNAEL